MNRTALIIVGLCLIADISVAQNILNNGDFEAGLMCYGSNIWTRSGKPDAPSYQLLLSTDAHSGAYSFEINCTGSDCEKAAIISDKIRTPPRQAYTLSLYSKCPAGRHAAVFIPGTAGGDTFKEVTCNDKWAQNKIPFVVAPGATDFFFYLYNRDTSWVRFDDVVLTYANGTAPHHPTLHPGTRDVRISGQTVLVDGAPYFARGFFDVPYDALPRAAATHANTLSGLVNTVSADCFNTDQTSYLDRAYGIGLNFAVNSTTTAELRSPAVFPEAVARFAPHLANIAWNLADEPDQEKLPIEYILPQTFLEEDRAAKTRLSIPIFADYQHSAWDETSVTQPYTGSSDIWMSEPYGTDFSHINVAVNTFNKLRRQPIWLAQDATDTAAIVPKAYWAVVSGVTGIFYFTWREFSADPQKMAAATQVFDELKQLNDVIFATSADSQVTPPPGIGTMARSHAGIFYILAAHPVTGSAQSQFRVTGLQAGAQVTVLFENRTITADAGGFTDSFAGQSRHVYSFAAPSPGAPR